MSRSNKLSKMSPETLKSLLHPTEDSRFDLALIATVVVAGVALVFLVTSFVLAAGFVLLIGLMVWFSLQVIKAQLVSNAVKVSPKSFPEIYAILQEVQYVLDYGEPVDLYIIEEGTVNAFLAKFFNTKFIILNSELVEGMIREDELLQAKWIIARFIGALKAKHYRLTFIRILIDSIEKLKVFNLFILPYERAIQYSGDQIGLAVCGDLHQSMIAFQKFMVGNELSRRVSLSGILEQERQMGFFAAFARLLSTHPHVVDRFSNLLAFAEQRYPEMYEAYVESRLAEEQSRA